MIPSSLFLLFSSCNVGDDRNRSLEANVYVGSRDAAASVSSGLLLAFMKWEQAVYTDHWRLLGHIE